MKADPRAVLLAEDIDFAFASRAVFSGWSASFKPGLTWLRGRNGSGKSTLLRLLGGALRPSAGRLTANGIEASKSPLDYRRAVFWCGPGPIAFDHLRPPEFFGFMRSLYPSFDTQAVDAHVQGFGLAPHLGLHLSALSTGTQRKVWVSAALAAGTPVVLLDEPLDALDAASRAHLQAVFERCAADASRAWIVTSHESLGAAEAAAHRLELRSD